MFKRLTEQDVVYISGPMSGLPEFNYPAFLEAEQLLLEQVGCKVLNPARNAKQESWEDYMRLDIKMLCDATAILLLPGHEGSAGAKLERLIAKQLQLIEVVA